MKTRRMRDLLVLSLAIAILLATGSAYAQKVHEITVTAATPAAAEQGVIELDVEISGSGFDTSVEAVFLVAGSETETADIVVLSNTYSNPKKMTSRISISDTALIGDYDIEIRSSSGRRGKGNTLFKVLEKDAGGGNSNHTEEVSLCITVVETGDGEMSADRNAPYCDSPESLAILESFEGSLRFRPNNGTKKNPSDRFLLVDAVGCTDRACDVSEVEAISTERGHLWNGSEYVSAETVALWDMNPGDLTRIEGRILLDRYRSFNYSTPNSDRITCPTNLTAPLWLSCDGKAGSDSTTLCDQWTLSSKDLGPGDTWNGQGDASPCLVNLQRGTRLVDIVELDFTIMICVMGESC